MDPINYSIDVQSPFQAALAGYQGGAAIRNDQLQQQQQQLAMQQQQIQQATLKRLMSNPNPTAKDFSDATILIPGMKDQFKQAWDMRSTDQQQNDLSHLGQVYAALQSGNAPVAADLLRSRAQALKNSGNEADAKNAEVMAGVVEAHPELAKTMTGMKLAAIPGGDKVISGAAGLGAEDRAQQLQPGLVAKGKADASTAESTAFRTSVEAGNAPTATELNNQKTAQDIKASQLAGQVSELNAQIAAANSETQRGQLTLERDKLLAEQAKLTQAQGTAAQDSQDMSTNALQTVTDIKNHPGMTGFFTAPGTKWGAFWRVAPGSDRHALETYIDSLKGQLGYSNLMAAKAASPTGASGFGALSEGELKLLSNLAGNLDPNSSDFPKQLDKVQAYLTKTQSTAAARPGLPSTGGAFVMKHPSYGVVTEGTINGLMKANPGATRDQVLQFLKSTGGQ